MSAEDANAFQRARRARAAATAERSANFDCTKGSGGEHHWPADLDGSFCGNGCGTNYDDWSL